MFAETLYKSHVINQLTRVTYFAIKFNQNRATSQSTLKHYSSVRLNQNRVICQLTLTIYICMQALWVITRHYRDIVNIKQDLELGYIKRNLWIPPTVATNLLRHQVKVHYYAHFISLSKLYLYHIFIFYVY